MTTFVAAAEKADPGDMATLNAAIALERAGIKAYVDAAATGLLPKEILAIASGFAFALVVERKAASTDLSVIPDLKDPPFR